MHWIKENGLTVVIWAIILIGGYFYFFPDYGSDSQNKDTSEYSDLIRRENEGEIKNSYTDYDAGYAWAEDNDIDNFDECQDEFGTGEAEDGCNEYVKENYSGNQSFNGYECTEDCSGHEAGYNWAEDNGIEDESDCGGNSNSFIEGCVSYVEDNF